MKRILLVEDELEFRLTTQLMLELEGCQVDCAADGKTAVAMACQHQYDCILMDLGLPKLDGIKACKAIKQYQAQNKLVDSTVIVAMTESTQLKQLDHCIDAGMTTILFKPVKPQLLQRLIKSLKLGKSLESPPLLPKRPDFMKFNQNESRNFAHRHSDRIFIKDKDKSYGYLKKPSQQISGEAISARICEPVVSHEGYKIEAESQEELKTMEISPWFYVP